MNSPETSLFNKSEVLFGLDKAKKDIRIKDYSILVEGQMDAVLMHQAGITNTVASSGTALSENHLVRLRRLSNRIIMAFDGDSAGFSASNRSAMMALSLGMELKIAQMPGGLDPADLAKENPEMLKEVLRKAKHIIDFYTDTLLERKIPPRELGKEIQKNVLPYVSLLTSAIEQSHFIKSIAEKTFIKEEALWDDLKKVGKIENVYRSQASESPPLFKRVEQIERKLIGIIWWQKNLKEKSKEIDIKKIGKKLNQIMGEKIKNLEKKYQLDKEGMLFETENYYNNKNNLSEDIEELMVGLEEEYLKKEYSETRQNLQKAEQTKNKEDIEKYLHDCQRISQRINKIKSG